MERNPNGSNLWFGRGRPDSEYPGRKVHFCGYCGYQSVHSSVHVLEHIRIHTGETYTCDVCRKVFSFRASCRRHMLRIHGLKIWCSRVYDYVGFFSPNRSSYLVFSSSKLLLALIFKDESQFGVERVSYTHRDSARPFFFLPLKTLQFLTLHTARSGIFTSFLVRWIEDRCLGLGSFCLQTKFSFLVWTEGAICAGMKRSARILFTLVYRCFKIFFSIRAGHSTWLANR